MKNRVSNKAAQFTESVIRDMTRVANAHGAINLAQGFPDFAAPASMKDAACRAIHADINQYAITWGAPSLRQAVAEHARRFHGVEIDPDREITVACGATECMIAALLATVDPGEEVVIFEPFYENYGPDAILSGAVPRFVPLRPPDWSFDPAELERAMSGKAKAIIVNTPNNPTGKVFSLEELTEIARLCRKYDVLAVTDEIYEHILYDGHLHHPIALLDGMRERTILINGASKTYSVTGWRVGYLIAPPEITGAIRKVHDFLTVGAAAPLQEAVAEALRYPRSYYDQLKVDYGERRDLLMAGLEEIGFRAYKPGGAYYIMTDFSAFGFDHDVEFAMYLAREIGVAGVPGSSFYHRPEDGRTQIRFAFAKKLDTLRAAVERLRGLRGA